MAVSPRLPDIGDVQEGGALQADLDEGRLHAGQDAADAAQVDVADQTAAGRPLDMQFLHDPLLHDGNAGFLRREIDQDFFGHTLYNSRFFLDSTMRKAPELLAPAGSLDMMRTAFDFGADAIYAGQPRYSLRVRNNEFGTLEKLGEGIAEAHARGKQFFVVSNIFPHNAKLTTYLDDMAPVVALKPDALIMSDPGLIDMVRETWPEQAVHLSVQSNTVNWAAVRFWKKLGLTRIILSRELSLDEVAEIRQQCPDIELEVFVHGALCIAYSGRCLLSGYFNHRDPNQGTCTNSCRWDYKVHAPPASRCSSWTAMRTILLEEKERPGELMPIEEDEHGTYIMNSQGPARHRACAAPGRDRCRFAEDRGPHQEPLLRRPHRPGLPPGHRRRRGRPPLRSRLLGELEGLANRGYTDGFYQRHHDPRLPELPARPLRIGQAASMSAMRSPSTPPAA